MTTPLRRSRNVSPCVSRSVPSEHSVRSPVGRVRLVMERFLVGSLYRHRGYWHSRIRDLATGRVFRMSSSERDRKKADKGLVLRLQTKVATEDAKRPRKPVSEMNPMERAVYELTGEAPPASDALELEWVEDENYQRVMLGVEEALRLAERGTHAITPEDLAEHVQDALKILQPDRPQAPRWDKAYDEFLGTRRVCDESLRRFRWARKVYSEQFKKMRVDQIKNKDVLNLLRNLQDQGKAAATQQYFRSALKTFFGYCVQNDYCMKNPVDGIPVPKGPEREGLPLTDEQCRRLLQVAGQPRVKVVRDKTGKRGSWMQTYPGPEWLFPAILISLYTGLRQGNVIGRKKGLHWRDIDLEQEKITIDGKSLKSKRKLELPIHPELLEYLGSLPPGDPDDLVVTNAPRDPRRTWSTVREAAALEGYLWKDMRTTFSTRLTDHDVPEPVIAALLDHSPGGKVTRRYAKATWNKKVEAIGRLPWLLTEEGPKTVG